MKKRTFVLLLLGAALLFGWTYHDVIQKELTDYLITQLEQKTGYAFSCKDARFRFPLELEAEELTITANTQPIAQITRLRITLNLTELFNKNLVIDTFEASDVILVDSEASSTSWELPPFPVQISRFAIEKLQVAERIVPKLQGSASCDPTTQQIELAFILGDNDCSGSCILSQNAIEKATFETTLKTLPEDVKELGIDCPEIQIQGSFSGSFEKLEGVLSLEMPSVSYKTLVTDQPCYLTAHCLWEGSQVHIPKFTAMVGQNPCSGALQIQLDPFQISGKIDGTLDLDSLQHGLDAKGILAFHARLLATGASVTLLSDQLQFDSLLAKNLTINWEQAPNLQTSQVSLTCQKVQTPYGEIEELCGETTLHVETLSGPFSLGGHGTEENAFELRCKGSWDFAHFSEWKISLENALGTIRDIPFALLDPVDFTYSPEQISLSQVSLAFGPGSLHFEGSSSAEQTHAFFFLKEMPMRLLKRLIPALPEAGILSGEAILGESSDGVAEAHLELQLDEIGPRLSTVSMPMQMRLKADLHDHALHCQGHFLIPDREPLPFSANIPLELSLRPLGITLDPSLTFSSKILLNHPIEPFLETFLPTSKLSLQGTLVGEILFSGTLGAPQISGSANLVQGTFELFDLRTAVHNLNAHFELKGEELLVTQLEGIGSASTSKITGTGRALLDWEKSLPFELNLQLKGIDMHITSYAKARAQGDLKLSGSLQSGLLQGKLFSEEFLVNIPSEMPISAETLEVTYMTPLDPAALEQKARAFWPLNFDLDLQIPKNGIISGEGWSSKWRGKAQLTGTIEALLLNGSCHLSDGSYRLSDKIFQITEGTITFAGDFSKKTSLYVIASKELDEIKAEIILKGPIKNPSISFRSNPPLPQREILSWILFNQGTSEITSFQGTQLNESISNLTMGNGKPDMLTTLRNRIGIDRIGIQREQGADSEGLSVQVGKYIAPNVLVSVNKSITAETNSLAVEATLQKNIKVQAEIGDDAEGQLLFKWKHDY